VFAELHVIFQKLRAHASQDEEGEIEHGITLVTMAGAWCVVREA
jgi:hypothetical protein